MKRTIILVLSLILVLGMAALLTSCGSSSDKPAANSVNTETKAPETKAPETPKTLEEITNADSSIMKNIQSGADSEFITVSIKGNTLTYSYDFSKNKESGLTEELARSETLKNSLKDSMAKQQTVFEGIAADLESKAGIKGISVVVEYTWKDYVIHSETYTSQKADK